MHCKQTVFRDEFCRHLVSCNLIRSAMFEAHQKGGLNPPKAPPLHESRPGRPRIPVGSVAMTDIETWIGDLLQAIAAHVFGNRPGRVELRFSRRLPEGYNPPNRPRLILHKSLPAKEIWLRQVPFRPDPFPGAVVPSARYLLPRL